MALEIKKGHVEDSANWHVTLIGDVDIASSNQLKEELNRMLDESERSIILDCGDLQYIDSTGLGVLIGVLKRVKGKSNDVIITNIHANISKLLRITGLDKIFVVK